MTGTTTILPKIATSPPRHLATSAALAVSATLVLADDYPNRPIELIVPYQAGGLSDAMARKVAAGMSEALPNSPEVVVINKPGGAATIGLTSLSKADPDGYTIAFTTSSPIAIQPHYGKVAYTADSFVPVAKVTEIPASFNVHKDSDIKSVEDLAAWAKENPGKFTYASTGGLGSGTHLAAEDFAKALGIEIRHVPFEGTAAMTSALAGKQIMGTMQSPDLHRGGNARPLVYLTNLKLANPVYDDTPTATEMGLGVSTSFFTGFIAPAGTAQDRVDMLADAIQAAVESDDFVEWLAKTNFPLDYQGPEAFAELLNDMSARSREQLAAMGLID